MKKITKDDLIKDVQRVINETSNTTRENYLQYGKYSRAPIKRLFGGWNNLLAELGYEINMHKKVSKEDVLNNMQELIDKFGYVNSAIQRKYGKYSQVVIDNLFGSWTNLAKILNQKVDGRQISNEEIKDNIIDIYNEYREISVYILDAYCIVSRQTIAARFGSVLNLLNELGIYYKEPSGSSKLSQFVLDVITEELNETPIYEYTFEWLVNPATKCNLRVDAYYPNHNLVVEVDGSQHFHDSDLFGPCEIQAQRDKIKDQLLKEHDIHLVRIKYNDKLHDIKSKIKPYI